MNKRTTRVAYNDVIPRNYHGEIEIEIRDAAGRVVSTIREHNLIKIYMKEALPHRLAASKKWDPGALNTDGSHGAWIDSNIDPMEEFSAKYIFIGATFDEAGYPLDVHDPRFYQQDPMTGLYRPIPLDPGASNNGGLINAVPINEECGRPIKRIEDFRFEPTYQPAGTPYLHDDVRALNNIMVLETTLAIDEYNGFSNLPGEYFTISEIALVSGKYINNVADKNVDPMDVFLEGPYPAFVEGGTNVVRLTDGGSECVFDYIQAGDQIKIVSATPTAGDLEQVSPWYLVTEKDAIGPEMILDRVPKMRDNSDISGDVHIYRQSARILAHRILSHPFIKSSDFEIIIRWRVIFS